MRQDNSPELKTRPSVAAAVSAALADGAKSPLLEAAELLVAACVRAARLYPEWAAMVDRDSSAEIDSIAQHLVAANLRPLEDAAG